MKHPCERRDGTNGRAASLFERDKLPRKQQGERLTEPIPPSASRHTPAQYEGIKTGEQSLQSALSVPESNSWELLKAVSTGLRPEVNQNGKAWLGEVDLTCI